MAPRKNVRTQGVSGLPWIFRAAPFSDTNNKGETETGTPDSDTKGNIDNATSSSSKYENVSYDSNSLMGSADDPLDDLNMSSSIATEASSFVKEILKPYEQKSKSDGTPGDYIDDFDSVGGSRISVAASADYDDDFEKAPPNVAAANFPSDYSADFNAHNTGDGESQLGSSLGIFEDLDASDGEGSTKYVSDSFEGESCK